MMTYRDCSTKLNWSEQWRHDQARRRTLRNRTEFINFPTEI